MADGRSVRRRTNATWSSSRAPPMGETSSRALLVAGRRRDDCVALAIAASTVASVVEDNDSYRALHELGQLIDGGRTGWNLCDVYLVVVAGVDLGSQHDVQGSSPRRMRSICSSMSRWIRGIAAGRHAGDVR